MILGTYLAYAIAMIVFHPGAIYPFAPDPFDDPAYNQEIIGSRDVTIAVSEGTDSLAVLFFMGNGGALGFFSDTLDAHQEAGRTVVALAYRGGGGVAGNPSEAGLKADALAAYDWLAAKHDGPIAVHGFSLGTGLAVHVAARRPVAAVLLDAPYARLCSLMAQAAWVPACYMPGVQKWDTTRDVDALSAPVLIQHGVEDQLIPLAQGKALADLMRDAGLDVGYHAIKNATHNDLAGQPGYRDRIDAFLAQAVD
ncbi:alpha/beta hydrolase [Yoonia sp.]|uniref:alpha/beta hydrolase n=1 Tax=Yoonia sp. TaxID=2212373 RepID=UPI0023B4E358